MNTNPTPTTYIGSIIAIKDKDDEGIPLGDFTVYTTDYNDSFSSRKLACVMLSHYLDSVDLPANLLLNLNIVNFNPDTNNMYYILDLTGNCDTVRWMLENEITILDGREQTNAKEKKPATKKSSRASTDKKIPVHPVRTNPIGFEYANRN
jgi:hypothetical protein